MLKVSGVSKTFGAELVLAGVSLAINRGERLGLVGPNGAGKSTLLQLIAGELDADEGTIRLAPDARVAYLPQYPENKLELTAADALAAGSGRVTRLRNRLALVEREVAAGDESELETYSALRDEFEQLGGYTLDARIEQVAQEVGLTADMLDSRVGELSGGYKTKLSLARLLLADADLVLLDEPTTYLDFRALEWLESFVSNGNRAFVIVSHDRQFLDRTVGGILEIDSETQTLQRFPGTYSDYAAVRRRELEQTWATYRDQQAEIARLEADIRRTRDQAAGTERQTTNDYIRGRAKKVAAKAKAREERLRRMIESDDMVEKPTRGWGLHLADLGRSAESNDRIVVAMEDVNAGYGGEDVLQGVSLEIRARDRLVLQGENGSGKTTLVRVITGEIRARGRIRLGESVRLGMLSQETSNQPLDRTVLDVFRDRVNLREDEARTYLHKFLFSGDEVFKRVGDLSYGQRQKLALACVIVSDANFLILDEPTTHLDIPALEAIEAALAAYPGPFLVISHDRSFLDAIRINRAVELTGGRIVSDMRVDVHSGFAGTI